MGYTSLLSQRSWSALVLGTVLHYGRDRESSPDPAPRWGEATPGPSSLPEALLADVLDNAPAAIFVKDPKGRYLYVNRQHEGETGISSEETIGQTDFDLFPPAIAAAFRKADLQTLEQMSPLRFEEPLVIQGRKSLFSIVKFPIVTEEEVVGVCGISIHIGQGSTEESGSRADRQSSADAFFGRLLASLTPQEVRVLDLVATGLSDRQIANKLDLSPDTVRHHVSHLLKKLRRRRAQVIIEMLKRGRG